LPLPWAGVACASIRGFEQDHDRSSKNGCDGRAHAE
jgi:hypothetical protein